jgi:hypothetical protein
LTSERPAILEQIQSAAGLARDETAGDLLTMIVDEHKHLRRLLKSLPNPEWLRQGHHPLLGVMSIEFLAWRVGEHAKEHAKQSKAAVGGKAQLLG